LLAVQHYPTISAQRSLSLGGTGAKQRSTAEAEWARTAYNTSLTQVHITWIPRRHVLSLALAQESSRRPKDKPYDEEYPSSP
jgi:hypothetical protein